MAASRFGGRPFLPISALQHLLFCERQCALIHLERIWAENRLTAEGRLLHTTVHEGRETKRGNTRFVRGLELSSERLGLYGIADIVEFREDAAPIPVEYKRGRPKIHEADAVQLCAQALCLEEMLGREITVGAIYYGKIRRRLLVPFDAALRSTSEAAVERLHAFIDAGITPQARRERKCERCSLLNLCMPDLLKPRATASRYLTASISELLAPQGDNA